MQIPPAMDEDQFWKLIDTSRSQVDQSKTKNGDQFSDAEEWNLKQLLLALPADQIIAFSERFSLLQEKACRWDLWGAAYWLAGGCGNDGFTDFRSTLISLGRKHFYDVLKEPDHIADLVDLPDVPYMVGEGFQYIAGKAYEEKTGKQFYEVVHEISRQNPAQEKPDMGEKFDFEDEDEMAERYPKLVAKYPEMGD